MDWVDETQDGAAAREELAILVFKHAGSRFGVAVDQVEAIIGLPPLPSSEQEVTCEYEGQALRAPALGAWLGLEDETGWRPSRVLIAHGHDGLRGFLVDVPRNILTLPLEEVYAMPVLLARALGASPFWGVGHDGQNDELILLLDLGAGSANGARYDKMGS